MYIYIHCRVYQLILVVAVYVTANWELSMLKHFRRSFLALLPALYPLFNVRAGNEARSFNTYMIVLKALLQGGFITGWGLIPLIL